MNRIPALFKEPGEKLIPFITAGYPSLELTVDLVLAAERSGADMIEIGMPFSDPLAEGPIIQKASKAALANGVTLSWIFEQVRKVRQLSAIPLVLMGYINPIVQYGLKKFIAKCALAGVDGLILPDLPPEEAGDYVSECRINKISPIFLVAPNTPAARIKRISELSGDLIYCVSILGITGTGFSGYSRLKQYLELVIRSCTTPFVVGFGISTRADVVLVNKIAAGAVVGSALIERIGNPETAVTALESYLNELRSD